MLKKTTTIIATSLLLSLISFSTCSAHQKEEIRVVVTLDILQTIVSPILGDMGEVYPIISGDVEPHSFTLTPSIIQNTLNSDLIVITGHIDWEKELVEKVSEERGVRPSLISLNLLNLSGIRILEVEGERNVHGFWLLPDNVIAIAKALEDKLSTLKPEYSEKFSENYVLFEREILKLKDTLIKLSEKYGYLGRRVVVGFYAEQYIAEAMGLKVDTVLIGEEETIRPETLIRIYGGFKSGDYTCIVVSDTALLMSGVQNALKEMSEETGCSIAYVSTISSNGLDRYDYVMCYNAGQVYSALLSSRRSVSSGLNVYLLTTILALLVIVVETVILVRGWVRIRAAR
ncbi:metal ABC transporter substrate-binding protein [Candidatus Bathyarchaeota archaeon]|nr:metal ABC transporter substrate-binding protein [Candidatus Bathyarchaeota archaeon]